MRRQDHRQDSNLRTSRATLISCYTGKDHPMANLTVSIEDDLLKRARIKALEQGTSVNALLRDYLQAYVGHDQVREALARLLSLARESRTGSGPQGRSWDRGDAHER